MEDIKRKAQFIYEKYVNAYDGELQGCCLLIADEIQRTVGGEIVAGQITWYGGSCRRTHWWVVKDGQILDPMGDALLRHEVAPGRIEIHRDRSTFDALLPEYEKWRISSTFIQRDDKSMEVFLGGTCNGSSWREAIIPLLNTGFFNPVVDNWTPACMAEEIRKRKECDICLYVITPKMTGVYSIAEVVDDSNKHPARTVLVILKDDGDTIFTEAQWKSLNAVKQMVERNGAKTFDSLQDAAYYINRLIPASIMGINQVSK